MRTLELHLVADPGAKAEALIKEARRRQRRRYLATAMAVAAALAGALGVLASTGTGRHTTTAHITARCAGPRPC